jgi:hypothetical protein
MASCLMGRGHRNLLWLSLSQMSGLCSLHGFRLTLEASQGAQLRLGAQNLASLGAGIIASGSGLTCHVIP